MRIIWTARAREDLERLYAFLAPVSPPAAAAVVQRLVAAPDLLLSHPRIGTPLNDFLPRDVRALLVGDYELRYELQTDHLWVLRIWHTREAR